jgi:transcriptional regulator with XRE-family HTH domain
MSVILASILVGAVTTAGRKIPGINHTLLRSKGATVMDQVISKRDAVIGKRIAQIREHRLMTQAALGEALGVSKHAIYRFENGHRRITVKALEHMARALRCKVNDLRMDPAEAGPPRVRAAPIPRIRPKSGSRMSSRWPVLAENEET